MKQWNMYPSDKKTEWVEKYSDKITSAKIEESGAMNLSNLFAGCSNLNSVDVNKLGTNNVTDMSYMFFGCSKLKKVDVSNFDIGNVADIEDMAY